MLLLHCADSLQLLALLPPSGKSSLVLLSSDCCPTLGGPLTCWSFCKRPTLSKLSSVFSIVWIMCFLLGSSGRTYRPQLPVRILTNTTISPICPVGNGAQFSRCPCRENLCPRWAVEEQQADEQVIKMAKEPENVPMNKIRSLAWSDHAGLQSQLLRRLRQKANNFKISLGYTVSIR